MEIYENEKKVLVVKISPKEAVRILSFGVTTGRPEDEKSIRVMCSDAVLYRTFICGSCNECINEDMYYIPSLNEVFCKDCIDDVIKSIGNFMVDAEYVIDVYNSFLQQCEEYGVEHNLEKIENVYEYMYSISDVASFEEFNNEDFLEYMNLKKCEEKKQE